MFYCGVTLPLILVILITSIVEFRIVWGLLDYFTLNCICSWSIMLWFCLILEVTTHLHKKLCHKCQDYLQYGVRLWLESLCLSLLVLIFWIDFHWTNLDQFYSAQVCHRHVNASCQLWFPRAFISSFRARSTCALVLCAPLQASFTCVSAFSCPVGHPQRVRPWLPGPGPVTQLVSSNFAALNADHHLRAKP